MTGSTEEPLYESDADVGADKHAGQRAARSLAAAVAKLHGAMPLPAAAQRLLAATQTHDYKLTEVVKIIESDPALATRIMRQASSALIGKARCTSIAQAVTMLGARLLQSTAVAASALEVFGEDEPVAKTVVEHMHRTGELARFLARHCGLIPEEMYTSGLLHDLGKLMLLRGGDLDYCTLLEPNRGAGLAHPQERERYGYDHAVLAGHVLNAWKLPHPLPRIVAWHHQPARAFRAPGQVPRMVALVRMADHLAYAPLEEPADAMAADLLETMQEEVRLLGWSADALHALCADLRGPKSQSRGPRLTPVAPNASISVVAAATERPTQGGSGRPGGTEVEGAIEQADGATASAADGAMAAEADRPTDEGLTESAGGATAESEEGSGAAPLPKLEIGNDVAPAAAADEMSLPPGWSFQADGAQESESSSQTNDSSSRLALETAGQGGQDRAGARGARAGDRSAGARGPSDPYVVGGFFFFVGSAAGVAAAPRVPSAALFLAIVLAVSVGPALGRWALKKARPR